MTSSLRPRLWLATLSLLVPCGSAWAGDPSKPDPKTATSPTPSVGLLDAIRAGAVAVNAQGRADGNMTLSVVNLTNRKLKVVMPPGLVASGASGQFGGMGGMGGGMGGMGGMGGGMGGMGGMGGGMGGMGGGMGGMGGRSGGMGGGMSGMGRPLTMMPLQGLSSVANLIMNMVQPETWDRRAFMRGMMAAMGSGGMMGGMGGMGMGGMGGGMGMGGMGGGFRSVPPTDASEATLNPGQTRDLATRLISLNPPSTEAGVVLPKEGERLMIGDVGEITSDPKIQKALRRLAAENAPETIAQLVLWNLVGKDWLFLGQMTRGWVNAQELALARQFVERLDSLPQDGESGRLLIEVTAGENHHEALAVELGQGLTDRMILGLKAVSGVPTKPDGPAVGCKLLLVGPADQPEAMIKLAESNGNREWTSMGKFTLQVPLDARGQRDLTAFGDKLAESILDRLVRAKLIRRNNTVTGTPTYVLQVDNASPLLLNGFALVGSQAKPDQRPHFLLGISLPPQRSLQFSMTPGQIESFGMKKGTHLVALDLSGL